MVKLPTIQPRGSVTRGAQSSVSPSEVANPFMQIAGAFEATGAAFEKQAVVEAERDGQSAVYRDSSGNLQVDRRSDFSAYGRAYNAAAGQGYAARLAGDIRTRGVALTNEAKGNIDTFNASWKGFRDQTLSTVPREYRGAVQTMLDTEGPRFALGVSEQKRASDLKEFEGNIKSEIQLLDDDMSALARAGGTGTDAYRQKQEQNRTLWNQLAQNPDFTVGQKEADIAIQRMESRHTSEAILGTVDRTLQNGGLVEARKLAANFLTDDKIQLSPAERRQYASLANERISGYTAQVKANLKPYQDQAKTITERMKTGVGLDNDDVDLVANELAKGGDMSGAIELYRARNSAKTLRSFGLSDNGTQLNLAETMFSNANGGGEILAAIQSTESSNNPNAVSGKGATGLMQVMPSTANEIASELGDANFPAGGTDAEKQAYLKKPEVSQRYGAHYFNKMMNKYGGDKEAALIAYNGGSARADDWLRAGRDDSVIPKESADYYKKVIGRANGNNVRFTPEDVTASRQFLMGRTDKDSSHIAGLTDVFSVKLSRFFQAAPPEIRDRLGIYSGARSNERQAELWQEALKKYGSVEEARRWVAPPGKSEHNSGNAADLAFDGQSLKNAPPEVVKWVHENAEKYGLKFPLGNENWHIEDSGTRGGTQTAYIDPEVVKEYRAEMTRDAKDLFTNIKSGGDKGFTPAVSDLNILTRQLAVVDDADFKREVADYFTSQSAIAAFQNMAPADVESLMSTLRADASSGATVAQQQLMSDLQASQDARSKALADDPLGYAASRGYAPPPPALDLSQPDSWSGTFQSLQKGVDVLKARGEVGNISALRPEMLSQVTRVFDTATPGESVQLLGSMAQNLRPDTYKATLGKLYSSGNRAAATAGVLVADNPAVAEGILRGQMLLKENPNLAPKKTDDNALAVDEKLPTQAFAAGQEGSRQFLLESATARYADLSHQAGDTSGEFNDTRMQQAITEVTGGVVEMNGYSVIVPRYGMTQDDFDKRLSQLTDADLADVVATNGIAVQARDVRDQARLRAVADGRYLVEFGRPESPMYATKKDGSAFVLDLRDRS